MHFAIAGEEFAYDHAAVTRLLMCKEFYCVENIDRLETYEREDK